MRMDVRQLHAYNRRVILRRFNRFVLDIQMFSFNGTATSWPESNFQKKTDKKYPLDTVMINPLKIPIRINRHVRLSMLMK